jgi:hypothetical protein
VHKYPFGSKGVEAGDKMIALAGYVPTKTAAQALRKRDYAQREGASRTQRVWAPLQRYQRRAPVRIGARPLGMRVASCAWALL